MPGNTPHTQLAGYDRWVAKANNASFAAQAAYDELVPAFEALFERGAATGPGFMMPCDNSPNCPSLSATPRCGHWQKPSVLGPHPARRNPVSDLHIQRDHHLGLPCAREVAGLGPQGRGKFDMECTYEEGDTQDNS